MNLAGIYHRPESEMAYLYTKDVMNIRLKTAQDDITQVLLLHGDPYSLHSRPDLPKFYKHPTPMKKIHSDGVYDYWQAAITEPKRRLAYAFELTDQKGGQLIYADKGFIQPTDQRLLDDANTYFRMPYFQNIDAFHAPKWVEKTVWYQIFPERFANGDHSIDPKGTLPWGSEKPSRTNFFGGDLQGVIDHLDYLEDLGINGIYFCPIFAAHSNHKYDTIDYFNIDPAFGSKEKFKELVDKAHERGIKIMLDAVFNHMGDFSMQWQDVIKNGEKSRFAEWFHINKFPVSYDEISLEQAENLTYEVFAKTPHMPKLNTANPEVQDYLLEIARYWIEQFDIDAWRLDVANEIDHHFWKKFYRETHKLKSDFYVVGEVWHSAQSWLDQAEFDGVMNYPFTDAIIDGIILNKINITEMMDALINNLMKYRDQNNQVMLNSLDTHDTARILTLAKGDKDKVRQALAFMFMLIGSPCIYYGTEIGMTGGPDPDCRRCMIWDKSQQDLRMFNFMKDLIAIRKKYSKVLNYSNITWSLVDKGNYSVELIRELPGCKVQSIFNFGKNNIDVKVDGKKILASNIEKNEIAPGGFIITVTD